jgi:integrase-like protein
VHGARYAERADAEADLFQYIEVFYNRRRRHSSLGYCSPTQFLTNWLSEHDDQTKGGMRAAGWKAKNRGHLTSRRRTSDPRPRMRDTMVRRRRAIVRQRPSSPSVCSSRQANSSAWSPHSGKRNDRWAACCRNAVLGPGRRQIGAELEDETPLGVRSQDRRAIDHDRLEDALALSVVHRLAGCAHADQCH